MDTYEFQVSKRNLFSLGLCADPAGGFDFTDDNYVYPVVNSGVICLTEFGHAFVSACRLEESAAGPY